MGKNYTVEKANKYIKENKGNLNKKYYPDYHFASQYGWINDPNGFSIFNNEYHLFYQYYPYASQWGPMHWGHAKSSDGIKWEHLDVALAPDKQYDQGGCFSGSAIEKDGKLFLMYTGHLPNETDENLTRQNQNIAISKDGVSFKKYENNPVLTEDDIPEGSSIVDFRDPKIFEKDNVYYCVIGSKTVNNEGQVLLYRSEDLLKWDYVSVFLPYNKYLGTMVECPDFVRIDHKEYFVLSAMNYKDENTGKVYNHISWLIEGEVDWNNFVFEMKNIKEMDRGLDFYAPQTVAREDGPVAIAWMQGWGRDFPSDEQSHGWAGQMTLPRKLTLKGDRLKQKVLSGIESYKHSKISNDNVGIDNKHVLSNEVVQYISIQAKSDKLDDFILKFSNDTNEEVMLTYDHSGRNFRFSRKNTNVKIMNEEDEEVMDSSKTYSYSGETLNMEIFIDKSSIELFVNDEITLSNTYYMEEEISKISIESKEKITLENISIAKIDLNK
ncbi:beta-fructofuranosidase [Alkalibacterium putridalgicola]|uniref:beta-fructofuranosidase n=1 Tax=Alkalibacterium putridalgicola TaxID=426703 RepID=A0A1H7VRF6_9LACT|nr:glycoside hydrolase family 32 protein [Alkalibacterium putridalgicola]GEK89859.1 beta-fructofuranosidase [Alkalibacterium putridalgicola]SEM11469.1 beta-fructofuranosidase [Alkalibacterium putridalgicola]